MCGQPESRHDALRSRPARVAVLLLTAATATGLIRAAGPEERLPGSPRRLESPPVRVLVEAAPLERVRLSVSVLDGQGRTVGGLGASDFEVREEGVARPILEFGREAERLDRPLSAVFLVDRSGSIGRQMPKWREACVALLSALRPIDEVRLAVFTSDVEILADFTNDSAKLAGAIDAIGMPAGGTRVFGAIEETLQDLGRRPGRKAIFLLTDGGDNDHGGQWNATDDPYLASLVRRAVRDQVTIVTILPGPTPALAVHDIAEQTGGWWLYSSDDLPALVGRLGRRLMESYYLAFDSNRAAGDTRRRRLEVLVTHPGYSDATTRTAFSLYGASSLFELLAEDLAEGDEATRARAAGLMDHVAEPKATGRLVAALKDDSPAVRAAAAEALGRRGDTRTARAIARLLRDPDPVARAAAVSALERMLQAGPPEPDLALILDALERAWDRPE